MRELKYRVWCIDHNEWEKDRVMLSPDGLLYHIIHQRCVCIRPETHIIQFYIGVKDINGKEIYEGDIVSFFNSMKESNSTGIVKCDGEDGYRYGVRCKRNNDSIWNFDYLKKLTIIGNKFDNPELFVGGMRGEKYW